MQWRGLVDSLVLALVIYLVLHWGREARAFRVSIAVVGLRVGAVVARRLGLSLTVWVLDGATLAALILVLIVFQAELRRALVRLDVIAWLLPQRQSIVAQSLQAVATAAFSLAHARRGALIVVAGDEPLDELVEGGVPLGGAISTEILEAIFRKVSPVQTLQAQLRGPAWILESADLTTLVARFDRAGMGEGPRTLSVREAAVNLPPVVVLDSVIPQTLSLRRSQTPVHR